jgi:hypothetical protein
MIMDSELYGTSGDSPATFLMQAYEIVAGISTLYENLSVRG